MYGVTTKRLNEQVSRNQERFPLDFLLSAYASRGYQLEVAICDLKFGSWLTRWQTPYATRLY